jgi:hypothetical protein
LEERSLEAQMDDEIFGNFVRRRKALNDDLDQAKRAIDNWFDRQPMPAPIAALANLEVLLKTRRDLLDELVHLDDDFMTHLIKIRSESTDRSQQVD